MEDNAPDVSMDYSFLLDSSVLDHNSSASASPSLLHGAAHRDFALSQFSQVCPP